MVNKMLRWMPVAMTRIAPAVIFALTTIGMLVQGGCSLSEPSNPLMSPDPLITPVRILTRPDDSTELAEVGSTELAEVGATRLTTPPDGASDQNPAFSPDGTQLVFTRFDEGYNDGPASLFLLDISSGQDFGELSRADFGELSRAVTRLTPVEDQDNVNLPGAAWNGVNDRIVFASDRLETDDGSAELTEDLWRIAPDGTDLSRITTHSDPTAYIEPSWSPDGQWIVLEISQPGASEDGRVGRIWKVRADGTGLTPLTDGSPPFSSPPFAGRTEGGNTDDRQPNWSPAGNRVLFQRRSLPDGQWDIYTIAPDGSGLQNVTDDLVSDDTDASWSPTGACIVYSTDHGGLPVPNLFVIPASGGSPVRVTFSEERKDGAPSWSPGGKWIAFESHESQDEDSPSALWRIAVPENACDEESHVYLPLTLTTPASTLLTVDDFLYQLQNLNLTAIGDTAYDLVVMDYSAGGDDETAFSAAQIAALQHSPGGDKIALAYMSIGEAEDYRFYWDESWDADHNGQPDPGAPDWLDVENPDWAGNYKVRYWDPAWQTIIFSYTNRLLNAGFDGAYLDIIDAYEYYADQGRATAAQEMADLVTAIRAHARARDPDFYIFPQNAPELAEKVPLYLNSVDGIGQEDIYYGYDDDDAMTPPAVTAELEGHLDLFKSAGKLVLTVDYATTAAHIDDAYAKSQAKGYVPFVTVRDLDQLTINPGHEPD